MKDKNLIQVTSDQYKISDIAKCAEIVGRVAVHAFNFYSVFC